ncbi:ParB N-terminal domain-containing protein [Rhizobium alvei]|uniref:ParB N-terminal domain-containing protein n=1 Tax=Rhizobium alvei TaxID=1132659 RepID=A0ABT8YK18_9HYPH|nr:ParB N-terminal domain-containing protein [Rhizobium alvei]MDO6963993.1 ParB N-terminal domain-containing protein [Rhizobium alvei]
MKYDNFKPEQLSLDRKNPRFGLEVAQSEAEALAILLEKANLKELWDSIAERGYEPYEPLVATEEDGELVVLEGNRRLAAVKFLLDPDLAPNEIARRKIPQLAADKLATCESVPVIVVENREKASGYIGFKHVNGPTRWSSLAKAKFGVDFYESLGDALSPQRKMQSLTKQLGDSRGLIIRLLVAYKIVLQAIELGMFDKLMVQSDEIEFSHLYTLINNPDSRAFIGFSKAPLSESLIINNPVPESHFGQLQELLSYLYGSKSVIKAQGTDRPRLQRVLASQEGLRELRTTGNLEAAETVAGIVSEDWLNNLAKIAAMVQKSASDITVIVDDLPPDDKLQADTLLKRIDRQLKQIRSTFSEE